MDVLKNLLGNLSNGVIRLIVTVGILAAVYFFIVKPTLDTTNNAINQGFDVANRSLDEIPSQQQIQHTINQANNQASLPPDRTNQLVRQLRREVHRIQKSGDINQIKRMSRCLQTAGPNLERGVRCLKRIR